MSFPEARLSDLLSYPLRSGVTVAKDRRGSGIPMVNMGELFRYPRLGAVPMSLVEVDYSDFDRYLLRRGDLLFARRSLTLEGAGKCCLVIEADSPTTWESSIIRARFDRAKVDPEFLYYYFLSPQGRLRIESIVEQVAAAGIRVSDLANLMVACPPIDVQQAVAEVLSALDRKIFANAQAVATMEKLLHARFAAYGFDRDVRNSEDAIRVDEVIEFNPKVPRPQVEEAVYVDMAALPTVDSARVRRWTTRPPGGGARFTNGDTVMARITPCLENGKTAFVDFMEPGEVGIGSTEFIVMRARRGLPVHFPYMIARSPRFRAHAIMSMSGSSGRQRCQVDRLVSYLMPRPRTQDLADLENHCGSAFALARRFDAESRTLATLRDTLLPQLITGKIRVKDATRVVEEAV